MINFIIHAKAGRRQASKAKKTIEKKLSALGIPYAFYLTERQGHATELARDLCRKGETTIVAVGGDGTLHEVVNGLFIQKEVEPHEVTVAVIAVGTGNDWIRMFGLPTRYAEAIRAIKEGYTFLQDVAAVEYEESMYKQVRYVANVAGVGFDAAVIRRMQHSNKKGKLGASAYLFALIRTYFKYKSTGVKLWIDGRLVYNHLLFSMAIGVGQYNGGGIQQLPEAVVDDGLLDLTLIRPLHWWNIIFRLKRLFNGNIYTIGHVVHAQGKHVRIESSPEICLEVDGELLGNTPIEIRNIPRAVRVVVNRSYLSKLTK
jgi:YegS/Rv2252/BmrU family lipid kinase